MASGADHDALIAHLHDVTHMEIERCQQILESVDWDLTQACTLALAEDGHPLHANGTDPPPSYSAVEQVPSSDNPWRVLNQERESERMPVRFPKKARKDNLSRRPLHEPPDFSVRELKFRVDFDGIVSQLVLGDSDTVGMLKEQIKGATKLPDLNGVELEWPEGTDAPISDKLPLKALRLPSYTNLTLKRKLAKGGVSGEALEKTWCLSVTHLPPEITYSLYETGDKQIADVKKDVHNLTGIPPSRQKWCGLPEEATDTYLLAECALDEPVHHLTVMDKSTSIDQTKSSPSNSASSSSRRRARRHDPSDSDLDKSFGHLSDSEDEEVLNSMMDQSSLTSPLEFLEASPPPVDRLPLIPEDFSSPSEAIENFTRVFEARYGVLHPPFYQGSLAEAMREAFSADLGIEHKRPVVLFLHHDDALSANVFNSNVLCSEQITSLLSANFVLWPWDCTLEGNRDRLREMVSGAVGSLNPMMMRLMHNVELFPTVLVLGQTRGSVEILGTIRGMERLGVEEVMMTLMTALEEHGSNLQMEKAEESERQNRELFRMEQETAFQETIAADRRKEEDRLRAEKEEQQRRRDVKEAENVKQAEMAAMESVLPEEPPESGPEPVATLRLRLPTGEHLIRRFLAREPVSTLLTFAASKGFPPSEFRLLTSFPKKDLTQMPQGETLEKLGLCPREQITVEER